MKTNTTHKGHSIGTDGKSRKSNTYANPDISKRTHELAEKAGRTPPYVIQEDYENAKRQIKKESESDFSI